MAQLNERQLDPAATLAAVEDLAPREPHRQYALKHEDCFMVADGYGDVRGSGDGLFLDDTRLLSRYRLLLGGRGPSLLGASLSQDNILFTANLTNMPLATLGDGPVPQGVVHLERTRLLWRNRMYERIAVSNYSGRELVVPIRLEFAADFRDMFEVRGTTRSRRGQILRADRRRGACRLPL